MNYRRAGNRRKVRMSIKNKVRSAGSRFRWQHCTECGNEGIGLAVLHLQDWIPCPVCKHSTVRRYGSPNVKGERHE
jgi:ribosomal protein S27E